jgi:hypothetical protein
MKAFMSPRPHFPLPEGNVSLDALVPPHDISIYERSCLRVLLADRLAGGYPLILDLYVKTMWVIALLVAGSHLDGFLVKGTKGFNLSSLLGLAAKLGAVYGLARLRR